MKFIKGEYRSEIGLFQYMEDNRCFYIGDHDLYGPFTEKFANGTEWPLNIGRDIESCKEVNHLYGNAIEGQKFAIYYVGYGFIRREIYTSYDYGLFWRRESTDIHLYILRKNYRYKFKNIISKIMIVMKLAVLCYAPISFYTKL